MIIDFSIVLKDIHGKGIIQNEMVDEVGEKTFCGTCKKFTVPVKMRTYELTLKQLCINVLTTLMPEEKDGEAKFKKFQLALKISSEKKNKVELEIPEIAMLKKLIGTNPSCDSVIVGRTWELLEQKTQDGKGVK